MVFKMKIRNGFVSNSSATAYIIINKTDSDKTVLDLAKETIHLFEAFKVEYDWHKDMTEKEFLKSAENRDEIFKPGENITAFGDEDGDTVGQVYDYMLRSEGESDSFIWRFHEWLR